MQCSESLRELSRYDTSFLSLGKELSNLRGRDWGQFLYESCLLGEPRLGYVNPDESYAEIAVLPLGVNDEDEGDENEVHTGEIIETDVPECLEAEDSLPPEPPTSSCCSTAKSRKNLKDISHFRLKINHRIIQNGNCK
ncbi:hypothetical protein TNCV_4112851 [Trichonephila clavipes]|nr:hypothetical protein TNCV_4112851 [Trichonephila clavipes]